MILKESLPGPERNDGGKTGKLPPVREMDGWVMTSGPGDSTSIADPFPGNSPYDEIMTVGRIRESTLTPGRNGLRLYSESEQPAVENTLSAGVMFPGRRNWVSEIRIWEFEELHRKRVRGVQTLLGNPSPVWKRIMDITGSFLGLAVLFPLFLTIAAFIKIVSPGPIFFSQKRVGYQGRLFNIWKFRTMRVDADTAMHQDHVREFIRNNPNAAMAKIGNDPRIIPFGKILRKTAVDELPQLFNVLRGDMSLVGPRPELPYAAQTYEPWPTERFDAVPGMTGLWQVSGKNRTTYHEMMRLDIRYILNRTFLLDIIILLKTFPVLVGQVIDKSKEA